MTKSYLRSRYSDVRRLGRSNLAEVWLARQSGNGGMSREVVIKRFSAELADHPRAALLVEEAMVGASLAHPHIAHVYDVGEDDGRTYVASERTRGATARQMLELSHGPLPLEVAVDIVAQVLEALRYAHAFRDDSGRQLKVVHRAVGPGNVCVSLEGMATVLDFGCAWPERLLRDGGRKVRAEQPLLPAHAPFIAPECARTDSPGPAADIYSAGALLYALTTGSAPGPADQLEPPTFLDDRYPADLENIVMRAIEQAPQERYNSAASMLAAVERFCYERSVVRSRVRVGAYVAKLLGVSSGSPLDIVEPDDEVDESVLGPESEALDFDQGALFGDEESEDALDLDLTGAPRAYSPASQEETAPGPDPAGTQMLDPEQVLEVVSTSDDRARAASADRARLEPDDGLSDPTIEQPSRSTRDALAALGVQRTILPLTAPGRVATPIHGGGGSTVVVTADLVEEEIELSQADGAADEEDLDFERAPESASADAAELAGEEDDESGEGGPDDEPRKGGYLSATMAALDLKPRQRAERAGPARDLEAADEAAETAEMAEPDEAGEMAEPDELDEPDEPSGQAGDGRDAPKEVSERRDVRAALAAFAGESISEDDALAALDRAKPAGDAAAAAAGASDGFEAAAADDDGFEAPAGRAAANRAGEDDGFDERGRDELELADDEPQERSAPSVESIGGAQEHADVVDALADLRSVREEHDADEQVHKAKETDKGAALDSGSTPSDDAADDDIDDIEELDADELEELDDDEVEELVTADVEALEPDDQPALEIAAAAHRASPTGPMRPVPPPPVPAADAKSVEVDS